ncbi:MAG: permease-like cell division protein FtsX [Defluviitaleaceae bacterium]|nr:permease-like cell division protein FtsX [Defluviitaleaceae bacterium]MCL2240198.1 permease-like cell division protein FtsX [Defluviitaleaceae bacterium]
MKPRTLRHFLKEAFRSLIVNRLMSFASILTVASCIFIVSLFYMLAANIDFFLSQLEDNLSIVVFVDEYLPPGDIVPLHTRIRDMPQVRNTIFVNRYDALEVLIEEMEFEGGLAMFESLRMDNPLRHGFIIELQDLRYHDAVLRTVWDMPEIANVSDFSAAAEIMITVRDIVQVASLVLILILAAIAIVLIMNTIRITVSTRQVEIGIMKYVGATDWFIRWPFIIEGLLIGFFGGLIPALLSRFGYEHVVTTLAGIPWLNFISFMPGEDIFMYVMPLAVGLGIIIGLIGSLVSVRRYLKV